MRGPPGPTEVWGVVGNATLHQRDRAWRVTEARRRRYDGGVLAYFLLPAAEVQSVCTSEQWSTRKAGGYVAVPRRPVRALGTDRRSRVPARKPTHTTTRPANSVSPERRERVRTQRTEREKRRASDPRGVRRRDDLLPRARDRRLQRTGSNAPTCHTEGHGRTTRPAPAARTFSGHGPVVSVGLSFQSIGQSQRVRVRRATHEADCVTSRNSSNFHSLPATREPHAGGRTERRPTPGSSAREAAPYPSDEAVNVAVQPHRQPCWERRQPCWPHDRSSDRRHAGPGRASDATGDPSRAREKGRALRRRRAPESALRETERNDVLCDTPSRALASQGRVRLIFKRPSDRRSPGKNPGPQSAFKVSMINVSCNSH